MLSLFLRVRACGERAGLLELSWASRHVALDFSGEFLAGVRELSLVDVRVLQYDSRCVFISA